MSSVKLRTLILQGPNLRNRVAAQRTLQRAGWHSLPIREERWLQIALEDPVQDLQFGLDTSPKLPKFRKSVNRQVNTFS